jgi:hypothetical protein
MPLMSRINSLVGFRIDNNEGRSTRLRWKIILNLIAIKPAKYIKLKIRWLREIVNTFIGQLGLRNLNVTAPWSRLCPQTWRIGLVPG